MVGPLNSSPARPEPGVPWSRRLAVWPVAALLRLWWLTLRIEVSPEGERLLGLAGQPVIFALWHNRLFLTPEFVRRFRRGRHLHALVSASGDGSWLTALFQSLGLRAVRGSSSRLGREAAGDAIEILSAGHDLGITPDGPRGPAYVMKPGAIVVARRTGAVMVLVGIDFASSWRMRSWDGIHLPKPFSRVYVVAEEVAADQSEDSDEAARRLSARLIAINPDRRPAPVKNRG
jgi:lysophospholipid acyltransferase (LPLAT)-like uncharacterized protein